MKFSSGARQNSVQRLSSERSSCPIACNASPNAENVFAAVELDPYLLTVCFKVYKKRLYWQSEQRKLGTTYLRQLFVLA